MSVANKHVQEIAKHIAERTDREESEKFVATAQKMFAGKINPDIDKADFQQVLSNLFGAATIYGIHSHNASHAAYCRDMKGAAIYGAKAETDLSGFDVCVDALASIYQPAPGDKMTVMEELDRTVRAMNGGLHISPNLSAEKISPKPRGKSDNQFVAA